VNFAAVAIFKSVYTVGDGEIDKGFCGDCGKELW